MKEKIKKKRSSKKSKKNDNELLKMINSNAAGIDIGSEEHWVCVPENRDKNHIQKFGAFTCDLHAIAKWLQECKITTVAMESTGVYWIPLFQILEEKGFKVHLVNARHVKNVPGRSKTDRLDCQWIQKLHSFGLLSASFRPNEEICKIRSLMRHRDNLIQMNAKYIQHMQKTLHQMNIMLAKVISDITGVTGIKIIEAIIRGERNLEKLASLKDGRIKASQEKIVKSLQGDYREEHIFVLEQSLEQYKFIREQIIQCDKKLEIFLQVIDKKVDSKAIPLPPRARKDSRPGKNSPTVYDARSYLYEITGVDLTRVPGFQVSTVQTIISEVGLDMHKWKTEKHFASWLGLCPDPQISGGKVLSTKTRQVPNRAARALRAAASCLRNSDSYLGAFYRRIRARTGPVKAITATARKLAIIFYHMLKSGSEYKELGENYYLEQQKEKALKKLHKQAKRLGYSIVAETTDIIQGNT